MAKGRAKLIQKLDDRPDFRAKWEYNYSTSHKKKRKVQAEPKQLSPEALAILNGTYRKAEPEQLLSYKRRGYTLEEIAQEFSISIYEVKMKLERVNQ